MTSVRLMDALIEQSGSRLILQNEYIRRVILLDTPLFGTDSMSHIPTGREWVGAASDSGISFGGDAGFLHRFNTPPEVTLYVEDSPLWEQPHLLTRIELSTRDTRLTRFYQIYPGCPVTVCWTELSGSFEEQDIAPECDHRGRRMMPGSIPAPVLKADAHDALYLNTRHLRIRNVSFTDCTDQNDNYVQEQERLAYPSVLPWKLEGNLVFVECLADGEGIFMLKESPVLADQSDQPDADFLFSSGNCFLAQTGWGFTPDDISKMGKQLSWRTVTGVYPAGEHQDALAVKSYLKNRCIQESGRDWMSICNQWGDRREGRQINEDFLRAEIDVCAELGIEAYLVDAGWQKGRLEDVYPACSEGRTPFYDGSEFWDVDPVKFPNGLAPVLEYARQKDVTLVFWFNTDATNENENWEKDAETLLNLHRQTDVPALKIDDTWLQTRRAFIRNRDLLEKVVQESGGRVSFQLDITAGARWGFFYAHHLGILYVENRYTHWKNYFPYRVHRNLWELSQYLMPQRMQFEFLNNASERMEPYKEHYPPDDPFLPSNYTLDYLFATVMFANPMAFLEVSALDDRQKSELREILKVYRDVRDELFAGDVFPLGEKPDGRSLTGFLSHNRDCNSGFVCVYREVTDRGCLVTSLPGLDPEQNYEFDLLCGNGSVEKSDSGWCFTLHSPRSYAFFRYKV